jgi:hypothetical protein
VSKLNHDFLIKTIIDNGGKIRGGYVREWILNGEPSDFGWEDVDCTFESSDSEDKALKILYENLGNIPKIDTRCQSFNSPLSEYWCFYEKLHIFEPSFFCNFWLFDGSFKLLEPAKSKFSYEEILEMTKNKIARCSMPFHYPTFTPFKIFKMLYYKWNIVDYDGKKISKKELIATNKLISTHQFPINGQIVCGNSVLDF